MPEGLWNRHTLLKVLDITPARLLELLRLELLPLPILLGEEPFWRAQEIRRWMQSANAATLRDAVAVVIAAWANEEAAACGVTPEGGHDA